MKIGDRVVKNPATWRPSQFDAWGAGDGVGVIVPPPAVWGADANGVYLAGAVFEQDCVPCVDVRWPNGRCSQRVDELLPAPDDGPLSP